MSAAKTAAHLTELRRLAQEATSGPWDIGPSLWTLALVMGDKQAEADVKFIGACDPATILGLLDRLAIRPSVEDS